jgi:hypothetical protein
VAVRNRGLAEVALFVGLTLLHTWPLASDPAHLSRLDNSDTAFNTWVVAWDQHQLTRDPLHLFEAPIFYPEHDTLAYSEHLIVPAIIGLPFAWAGASPVLLYNLLVMLAFVLSGLFMCRLVTIWTGSIAAGVIAGALFAFNAHVLTRFAHLQALHVEFIPIVLYALDRLLTDPRLRYAALLAVGFVLQSLCSNHTMVMLGGALAVAVLVRPETWHRPRRVWSHLALAGAAGALALTPILLPYYRVHATQGLNRSIEEVRLYSATWADYFATAGRVHYSLWAHRLAADRTALFPGFTAVLLSLVAIATGEAWRNRRARLLLPFAVAGVLLSFGANLPGYAWLQDHIGLLQGIRAAARWGYLLLVAVAVLAGFGVAVLQRHFGSRSWWAALVVALVGAVTIEALRAPLALVRFEGVPSVFGRMRAHEVRAIVMYPLYQGEVFYLNARYLLDQTRHWKPLVNGYSGFAPESYVQRAARLNRFPAPEAIAELRALGVSHAMLHYRAPELRSHPDLELVLEQEGWSVYRIR